MATYKIIGADQKEYGPVSLDQVRQWINEGRANGQTMVQLEGETDWRPLSAFPELAQLVPPEPPTMSSPPPFAAGSAYLAGEPGAGDYQLDIGLCFSKGYELLKNNFGLALGGCAVFLLLQMAISGLAQIPFVGILVSVASLIITGPLTGGLWYLMIRLTRRQPAEIGDVFAGFRLAFGQLLAGYLVSAILAGLAALPGIAVMAFPIFQMVQHNAPSAALILVASFGLVVAMIPALYLGTCWKFTLPLIIDRGMDFWAAMGASRRQVGRHWWLVFGLAVVGGLLNVVGLCACCVGIFFTIPISFGAFAYAYETIFAGPAAQTH